MYLLSATPEMTDVFQRLCHMKPGSGIGMVGLGSVLLHQKEFLMARALLQKGTQSNFELIRMGKKNTISDLCQYYAKNK